jgi:hypothetical protein
VTAVMTACDAGPSVQYTTGEVLLTEPFDEEDAWETFASEGRFDFKVADGVYHIVNQIGEYVWGQNLEEYTDVVIEATSRQLSEYEDNFYGVMCRAHLNNDGRGYYFLISGDGFAIIMQGNEEDSDEEIVSLAGPKNSNAINKGQGVNVIRAVCIGDYLALYVNGNFVMEARDADYTSGAAGFAAAFNTSGTAPGEKVVEVTFDNLTITEASVGS